MQQPELGRQLAALRKEQNLTQEELVEKSHVSVRTIQRIEAGEVIPRLSTVKILWQALGAAYSQPSQNHPAMNTTTTSDPLNRQQQLLVAVIAGALYLAFEISLAAMELSWLAGNDNRSASVRWIYIALSVGMTVSYALFARGFLLLASLFENRLLTVASVLMMVAIAACAALDITMFDAPLDELGWPYSVLSVFVGTCSLVFGIALLRLQDGMGGLAKIAGVLEVIIGCVLITVVLFFVAVAVTIPATVIEILLLYHGYEYLSKSHTQMA